MAKKTYYMILGVSHGETQGGIRAAYRDRARQLHPDVASDGATRAFQDVPPMVPPGEIYEVALGGLGIDNFRLRLHVFVNG